MLHKNNLIYKYNIMDTRNTINILVLSGHSSILVGSPPIDLDENPGVIYYQSTPTGCLTTRTPHQTKEFVEYIKERFEQNRYLGMLRDPGLRATLKQPGSRLIRDVGEFLSAVIQDYNATPGLMKPRDIDSVLHERSEKSAVKSGLKDEESFLDTSEYDKITTTGRIFDKSYSQLSSSDVEMAEVVAQYPYGKNLMLYTTSDYFRTIVEQELPLTSDRTTLSEIIESYNGASDILIVIDLGCNTPDQRRSKRLSGETYGKLKAGGSKHKLSKKRKYKKKSKRKTTRRKY